MDRIALVLAISGFIAILFGVLCLPAGLVNPKVPSSLFAVLAASGTFVQASRLLFVIGGLLMGCSGALKLAIRASRGEGRR
jgi:hypothetical protein